MLSLGLKDTLQPEYPYQSYSARFTSVLLFMSRPQGLFMTFHHSCFRLNNMSGSFNTSVWQQLGTTSSSGGSSSTSSGGSRSGSSSSSSGSSSKSSSSSSGTKSSSGSDDGESGAGAPGGTSGQAIGGKTGGTTGGTTAGTGAGVAGVGAGSTNAGANTIAGNSIVGNASPTVRILHYCLLSLTTLTFLCVSQSSRISIASASPTTSTTAPTTSSSSAAATRLSAPFAFKAPNTMARISQPGSPEGRTATLMITSVLVGVFGFGLAIAL